MKKELSEKQKQFSKWTGRGIAVAINSILLILVWKNIHWSAAFLISGLTIDKVLKGWNDRDNAERNDKEMSAMLERMATRKPVDFDPLRPFMKEDPAKSKDENSTKNNSSE